MVYGTVSVLGEYIATKSSLTPLLRAKNRIHFIVTILESLDHGTVKVDVGTLMQRRNGGSTEPCPTTSETGRCVSSHYSGAY